MPSKTYLNPGEKYNHLIVVDGIEKDKKLLFKCVYKNCGNLVWKNKIYVVHNHIKSCGCFRKEKCTNLKKNHGLRYTRLYRIHQNMMNRCYNRNVSMYRYYGGKGIKVCKQWLRNFLNFYNWAIQNGYQEELTIERKNNSKDYCPENCCWIPRNEQSKNTSQNMIITAWGETKIAADWLKDKRCEISQQTLSKRIIDGIKPEIAMKKVKKQ